MPRSVGDKLGRYDIVYLLGKGGMGRIAEKTTQRWENGLTK